MGDYLLVTLEPVGSAIRSGHMTVRLNMATGSVDVRKHDDLLKGVGGRGWRCRQSVVEQEEAAVHRE